MPEPVAAPACTIAALATTVPFNEFKVETNGCAWPAGHRVTYCSELCGTTVTLSEYAVAVFGMPQPLPGIGTFLWLPPKTNGPPNVPVAFRVSITRQGVTGTNKLPV